MDNQTLNPGSAGPFTSIPTNPLPTSGGGGGGRRGPLVPILLVVLGLGTIIFGILTVVFANNASNTQKSLNEKVTQAAAQAKAEQKKADDDAARKAAESPYRAYTAPEQFGSFVINFPKSWSSYVELARSGVQVQLILNPDFIRKTNSVDEIMATRVILNERTKDQYLSQYTGNLKNGKLKQAPTTVSGLPAIDLVGTFNGKKTIHEVVVPIRDKVLVFSTEDAKYATQFNEILAQSKIIP